MSSARNLALATPVVLLAVVLSSGPAWAQKYTAVQRAKLDRGEIVTRYWKVPGKGAPVLGSSGASGMKPRGAGRGWAAGVIDASPEQVFAVVGDVMRYGKVFPRVTAAKIMKRRSPTSYDWFYRIDMPWPLEDHWCITRNTHILARKRRRYTRKWHLLRGSFIHNQGSWQVSAWGKNRSILHYSVMLKPKMSAPDFVLHHVSEVALPRSVKAMRKRIKQKKLRPAK